MLFCLFTYTFILYGPKIHSVANIQLGAKLAKLFEMHNFIIDNSQNNKQINRGRRPPIYPLLKYTTCFVPISPAVA